MQILAFVVQGLGVWGLGLRDADFSIFQPSKARGDLEHTSTRSRSLEVQGLPDVNRRELAAT